MAPPLFIWVIAPARILLRHRSRSVSFVPAMKWILVVAAMALLSTSAIARQRPLLNDPVALNIGVNCAWQQQCMARQRRAMNSALDYVARRHLPHWRVQQCNRNASRGGVSMDWIGFDHCIRNAKLRAPATRKLKKRRR
jgi:hypothetical protein